MLNFFFKEDTNNPYLISQADFRANYILSTESNLIMGEQNPPIKITNVANLVLEQTVLKKKIMTSIRILNVVSDTDNHIFKEALRESDLFTDIISQLEIERNLKGQFVKLANIKEIRNDWEVWKEQKLPEMSFSPHKERKLIDNFERGLNKLDEQLNNNFQYTILLPEFYKWRDYPSSNDLGSLKIYSSRLVEDLHIYFKLKKDRFSENGEEVELYQKVFLSESQNEERTKLLNCFYRQNLPDFSSEQYEFDLSTSYLINKQTSEIIQAEMQFKEELHSNFKYEMKFLLKNEKLLKD